MAEREHEEPRNDDAGDSKEPCAAFRIELRDSLPGDRAVVGVEQEGAFVWLASRKYIHPKAVDELTENLTRIMREGRWVQSWPGN